MFRQFNWNKVKVNRWSILIFALLLIVGIQSCRPGECLESMVAVVVAFIIVSLVILVLSFLIPFVGPILGILLIGYLFVDGCLGGEGGVYNNVNKSCGCSAFCQTIKPEKLNQISDEAVLP